MFLKFKKISFLDTYVVNIDPLLPIRLIMFDRINGIKI